MFPSPDDFSLDPSVTFLNHGSFGSVLRVVQEAQTALQAELEAEPVHFLGRRLPDLLRAALRPTAQFLNADVEGLAFVPNATTGVATVLRGLDWAEGDELLIASHGYNAVKKALSYLEARYRTRTVLAEVPFPLAGPQDILDAFAAKLSPRTRLVVIDHVTSPTALIFPVAELIAMAHAHGALALVDGAHAPGLLPLDIQALGADFYTGNLHKWVCTARGTAILWVAPPWRGLSPLAVSHDYGAGFAAEHLWTGTSDPTPWLTAPVALAYWERVGWEAARAYAHGLVQQARAALADALGVPLPHPDDPQLYGPMAALLTPPGHHAHQAVALSERLLVEHRIELPFMFYDDRLLFRISAQIYNRPEDYARLVEVLPSFLSNHRAL